jgi:RNA polymerase sigma factor (sigma-70 family)
MDVDGDSDAAQLYEARLKVVQGDLRRRIARGDADAADDLFQEVAIRLWRRRNHYDATRGPYTAWALRVCDRVCLNAIRRLTTLHRLERAESVANAVQAAAQVAPDLPFDAYDDVHAFHHHLANAIVRLPPRKRAIAIAYFYFGKAPRQIAQEFGMKSSSVWTALSQAKVALRGLLSPPPPRSRVHRR